MEITDYVEVLKSYETSTRQGEGNVPDYIPRISRTDAEGLIEKLGQSGINIDRGASHGILTIGRQTVRLALNDNQRIEGATTTKLHLVANTVRTESDHLLIYLENDDHLESDGVDSRQSGHAKGVRATITYTGESYEQGNLAIAASKKVIRAFYATPSVPRDAGPRTIQIGDLPINTVSSDSH